MPGSHRNLTRVVDRRWLAVLIALYWQPSTTPDDARKSVAVARFQAPGNDADRLLGDDISQELLRLLRVGGVPVVHQEAMWTLPTDLTPSDVLQRVGARFLVDGALRAEGKGFLLTVTLTDGAADVELWRKEMRSSATDVFALNRQLAREIIGSLGAPFEQVASASAAVDREAYTLYLQGLRLLRQFGGIEDLQSARTLLERSIDIDSTFGEAYAALCRTHLQIYGTTGDAGDFENAERYCHRALTREGRDATIHLALGDLYAQSGQTVKATDQYDQALLLDAELADAYIGLGKVLATAQESVRAEQAFQQAVTRQPGYWQGFNDLGSFYVRAGRLVEAIEAYTRVTYLRPDNAWAFNNRGGARYFAGDLEGAIVDWERANTLEPGPYILSNIGTAYFHLQRFADAATKYREALDMNPNDHAVWGNLGDTYRVIPERRDEAAGAYERQLALANDNLKINRSNAEALSRSAVSLAFMGRSAEALKSIEQAVELSPDNITVLYDAGVTYVTLGEFDRAVDALKRAIDVGYSASFIDTDPLFDDLRNSARYAELIAVPSQF